MISVAATVNGRTVSILRKDLEAEEGQDPHFFDADYSVAASTAWLVWEGSWAVVQLLREQESWLSQLVVGKHVLELGSGTGLLGLALAAAGGHVVMTDVGSMVGAVLQPNVEANAESDTAVGALRWASVGCMRSVGAGSAAAQTLDWWQPLERQLFPIDVRQCDVIIAAECAWLQELVDPFVDTMVALLSAPQHPLAVLAFRERATATSDTFVSAAALLKRLEARGCKIIKRGSYDAPESRGLFTCMYELSLRD
uniref:Calmodulin-lysine N-methyltransferase n=1 Tax=Coccolithus braarudii TaxID=221442 RepID=A0A7S0L401_9EUKA|mmetsp:Transcript_16457/g.35650  ORF Transcript_16457/g.35650 Transcript_16457/m.35650 type:complete len:254 (+) Transcript_16457:44-805(+)